MWHYANWIVLVIYFLGIVMIGFIFSKKNKNSKDYFTASGKIPTWVTALSIYATALSSISFIAIPASIYSKGWMLGLGSLGAIFAVLWAARKFVRFFREAGVSTAYEFLEVRFDRGFRVLGSLSFVVYHVVRTAIVLYLPTLAIVVALPGVDPVYIVIVVGALCVIYTSIGGISAVVWSDAIQALVLILGAGMIMYFGFSGVGDGVDLMAGLKESKMLINSGDFEFSWDLSKTTFWVMIIGGFVTSVYPYVASQDIVQRYSTTKNLTEAKRSLYFNIPLLVLSTLMFIGMGYAIYSFFNFSDVVRDMPSKENMNAILPFFVINYVPVGLSGLIIAAIFAATQSTVSSSLNSISVCVIEDLTSKRHFDSELKKLALAKGVSWGAGVLGILLAIYFIVAGMGDMFLFFQSIIGLVGSPIAGVFLVGIFFSKVSAKAMWIGFALSLALAIYLGDPAGVLTMIFKNIGYVKPAIFEFLLALMVIGTSVGGALLMSIVIKDSPKEIV